MQLISAPLPGPSLDDVSADSRYLACSIETKSEIVVPIRANGRIVGEIDIDSHALDAFGLEDRGFLEECAEMVGQFLSKQGRIFSEPPTLTSP